MYECFPVKVFNELSFVTLRENDKVQINPGICYYVNKISQFIMHLLGLLTCVKAIDACYCSCLIILKYFYVNIINFILVSEKQELKLQLVTFTIFLQIEIYAFKFI